MLRLKLDLKRIPLAATVEIGGRVYRMVVTRNHIGGYPVVRLEDPATGRLLWVRPLHYGMDALYGFCEPGAEGYALIPLTASVGLRAWDAELFRGTVPVYLIPGSWKGHDPYPRWVIRDGNFVEEAHHRDDRRG